MSCVGHGPPRRCKRRWQALESERAMPNSLQGSERNSRCEIAGVDLLSLLVKRGGLVLSSICSGHWTMNSIQVQYEASGSLLCVYRSVLTYSRSNALSRSFLYSPSQRSISDQISGTAATASRNKPDHCLLGFRILLCCRRRSSASSAPANPFPKQQSSGGRGTG